MDISITVPGSSNGVAPLIKLVQAMAIGTLSSHWKKSTREQRRHLRRQIATRLLEEAKSGTLPVCDALGKPSPLDALLAPVRLATDPQGTFQIRPSHLELERFAPGDLDYIDLENQEILYLYVTSKALHDWGYRNNFTMSIGHVFDGSREYLLVPINDADPEVIASFKAGILLSFTAHRIEPIESAQERDERLLGWYEAEQVPGKHGALSRVAWRQGIPTCRNQGIGPCQSCEAGDCRPLAKSMNGTTACRLRGFLVQSVAESFGLGNQSGTTTRPPSIWRTQSRTYS